MRFTYKLLEILKNLIFLLVCAAAVILLVPMLFGCRPYAVVSGSMSPAIPKNAVVFVSHYEPGTVEVGDVIVFQTGASALPVTHRVVSISGDAITTKGDANDIDDFAPVQEQQIIGKVKGHVPSLGVLFGENSVELLCLAMAVYLALLLTQMLIAPRKPKRKRPVEKVPARHAH